ncbi:MAG: DPP IV N-terminal domain-containing protein [Bacteroidota bacterium]
MRILLFYLFICFSVHFYAQEELTNELIWYSGEFRMGYVSGLESMNDGLHYTQLDFDRRSGAVQINKYAYKSGEKVATLFDSSEMEPKINVDAYEFSADESQLLLATDQESIYRHSSKANYYVYNISNKSLKPITDFSLGKQRLADFSPKGNKVAFVRANNLYYTDFVRRGDIQISSDGKTNEIINGATDWVNEEEFGFDKGFEWSPDGKHIAYYKFDESSVKEFQMAMYGDLYPDQYTFKYPKAGEENATNEVWIYNLEKGESVLADCSTGTEYYIPRIKWMNKATELCVMRMNRHQNHLEFLRFNTDQAQRGSIRPQVIFEEKHPHYIEINDNLIFLEDNSCFLWNSDRDGYNHIYQFDMQGNAKKQITSGSWDVIDFIGYDEKRKKIYYTSAENGPEEKQVYSVGLNGKGKKKLSAKAGQNDANFSSSYQYYINYHSDANTPYFISLHNSSGKLIRVLEDNEGLKETISKYDFQTKEFFEFNTSENVNLKGWMIKPPNFDASKKYPVFLTIYGGPGHNTVSNGWGGRNLYWHQMIAQKGYIVVSVDNRGTLYRGRDFKNSTYLQLGKLETLDQIETAKYLASLPYVDGERIGVQGWSYGGFMASHLITQGADHFKMGIAVAPVTNWKYYDTIYTERFMRTPQENDAGYEDNSPINHVDKLEGAFLLVHGSADDNVHYQNTMEMINALVAANKEFDLFIYPDRNHGIYGGTTRLHLFNKMTNFILENL